MRHQTYVEDVVLRRALLDIWRAQCSTCRWEGPKRYEQWRAIEDGARHEASSADD